MVSVRGVLDVFGIREFLAVAVLGVMLEVGVEFGVVLEFTIPKLARCCCTY